MWILKSLNLTPAEHSLKLKKKRFNTELRQHFFTDRIINLWNSLDEQIVSSTSMNCFKNGLEKLRKQHKLMGHVQSCFGYWSPEAEPVPPLVTPRPGELPGELCRGQCINKQSQLIYQVAFYKTLSGRLEHERTRFAKRFVSKVKSQIHDLDNMTDLFG